MSIYDELRSDVAQAETLYNQALSDLDTERKAHAETQAEYEAYQASHPDQPSTPTQPQPQPPAASSAKIGANWKAGESLPKNVTHLDSHRFFFPPGKMKSAQTWGGATKTAHDTYGCRNFSISFKPDSLTANPPFAPASVTNITNYLKSIPADVKREDVYVTFFHEHDGDIRDGSYTLALYKQGSKQVADVAHSLGMKYGPIHNGWPMKIEEWKSKEADLSLYDFWGADCYSDAYQASSPYMDVLKTYADSLKLPLLLGEVGAPATDQAKQTAWCKQAREWALKNTRVAHYWSSQVGDTGTPYQLTEASAKAWFGL